jgi:kynurenine formamidase
MNFIDLSHPLRNGTPSFPGDPAMKVKPHCTIPPGPCRVSLLELGSHQGTHLDALSHFIPNGKTTHEMPLDWFYGPATILRLPRPARADLTVEDFKPFEHLLVPGAKIIYETGWHRQWGQPNYFTDFPNLTQAAAGYLAERRIRLLGMDTPTPGRDFYEVHHLLQHPAEIVIVESLTNLDRVPDNFLFIGFPLHLEGCDGSPIRAVAGIA